MSITEETVERVAIDWFLSMGYSYVNGLSMAPGEAAAERDSFKDVVLERRLRDAIDRLNPQIPSEAREDAFRKVVLVEGPSLIAANQRFHSMLSEGVSVEYRRPDGSIAGDRVRLVDFANADMNDWLIVNQFTVIEGQHNRRPDIVVFLNGLPIAVIELKNAVDENASIRNAFKQLQTYKEQIPTLFRFNEFLVISDGLYARAGSLTANWEWFKVWRTIHGDTEAPAASLELEVLMRGMFDRVRLLEMVRNFIALNKIRRGAPQRFWLVTTSFMPLKRRLSKPCAQASRAVMPALVLCGTRRVLAKVCPCFFMRAAFQGTQRWRIQPLLC